MGRRLARALFPLAVTALLLAGGGGGRLGAALVGREGVGRAGAQEIPANPPGLAIGRRAITLLEVDASSRTLTIFERLELRNEGDAAFVPSVGGAQGPMGLLRFGLPRNAFDLTLDERLSDFEVIQVDRGFASLMPLSPGSTDVGFSYRVPYARGEYELSANATYPTQSLWVLVPADLTASSAELRLDRVADIGRFRYAVLVADDLSAGQRASASIAGLPFTPRPWWLDESVQRAGAALLALAGVLLAWGYARARGSAPARPSGATPAPLAETADL